MPRTLPPVVTGFDALDVVLAHDLPGAVFVAVAIVALFGGAELSRRLFGAPVEATRKATHVGAGAIVMTFPWLFAHTATLVVLALAFAGILVGGRVTGLLGSIHDVERNTGGAYYYPFAVLGAWILSDGEPLAFCVPLAVMAVADAGAAMVGQRVGETTYRVMDGERSLEGSLAFFSLAFGVVLVGCSIAARPGWPGVMLVALVVAGVTTAVEAVSVRGSDNLAVPYFAWLALAHTERLGLAALGDWVLGMGLGLLVLSVTANRAGLSAAGGATVFLVGTLTFALGGIAWFAPLVALYAIYLATRPADVDAELDVVFPSTAGSIAVLLVATHTGYTGIGPFLASVCANGAVAMWYVAGRRGWPQPLAALAGALLPAIAARLVLADTPAVVAVASGLPALAVVAALTPVGFVGRRIVGSVGSAALCWGALRLLGP